MKVVRAVVGSSAGLLGLGCYCYFSGSPWFFQHVAMPAIRVLDPETAHKMSVFVASKDLLPKQRHKDPDILHTTVWGKPLSNPLGLAAGYDKHAEAYEGMLGLGFGFVEVGSVTPEPQPGNPRPRVFRLDQDKAVINRYGFNSDGHQVVRERLRKHALDKPVWQDKLVGVNLGKNTGSKDAVGDYTKGVRTLGEFADYLVINVSCPNTPGREEMQGRRVLGHLLDKVLEERDQLSHKPPVLVKIAPDLTSKDKEDIAAVITRPEGSADGLIVTNTTVVRPASLQCHAHAQEAGGLSGQPLRDMATQTVADMYQLTGGRLPIVGVGGVSSGRDAYDKIAAGASLVQVYTAMTYEGSPLVSRIKTELVDILRSEGYSTVAEAVGAKHREKSQP